MRLLTSSFLFVLLLFPMTVLAELPERIKADFAPQSGYIIMPIGDEFLVDLDAAANLQEGDILTLVMPGEKVVHPVTKEVLGTIDIPTGFLQVSRIKSGYSYAKLLFSETPPEKGSLVKRFEQVPTNFSSTQPADKLRAELEAGLPHLNWLKEASATPPLLTFNLQNNLLTVENSSGVTIKSYQYLDDQLQATAPRPVRNQGFAVDADPAENKGVLNKAVNNLIDSIGLGTSKDPLGPAGIIRSNQSQANKNVWMSANLGDSPVGMTVAEVDGDGQQETIIATQSELLITSISQGKLLEEARIELPAGTKCVSIDSFDDDKNGTAEIYLTCVKDNKLNSMVVEYRDAAYQISIKNISWFLRAAELPETGLALIGQQMGTLEQPFYGKPFVILREGDQLVRGAEIDLPAYVNIFSFLPISSNSQEGQLYSYLSSQDYLHVVSAGGVKLWESGDYFGGSEVSLINTFSDPDELLDPVYIQKRILRGPKGEVLVAQNEGLRSLDRFRMFKSSRVVALTWNGFAMQESWSSSPQNGYLADFAIADADNDGADELVMAVKFKHDGLLGDARSSIVIYELN